VTGGPTGVLRLDGTFKEYRHQPDLCGMSFSTSAEWLVGRDNARGAHCASAVARTDPLCRPGDQSRHPGLVAREVAVRLDWTCGRWPMRSPLLRLLLGVRGRPGRFGLGQCFAIDFPLTVTGSRSIAVNRSGTK
jgi:hypothetical protein